MEIAKQAAAAAENHGARIIIDRSQAIVWAIGQAKECDVVLLAGKGHEDFQAIKGENIPFSDIEAAKRALVAWGCGQKMR